MYSLLSNSEIATPVGHLQNVCFKARHPPLMCSVNNTCKYDKVMAIY